MVMLAPGMDAPEESVTTPEIDPVIDCARHADAAGTHVASERNNFIIKISLLPSRYHNYVTNGTFFNNVQCVNV